MPSSSVSDTRLNKLSIISTFGDCVRTAARYREIKGHCLELTTYNLKQNMTSKVKVDKRIYHSMKWQKCGASINKKA